MIVNTAGLKFSYSTSPQSCLFWDYYISKILTLFSASEIVYVLPLRSNKIPLLVFFIVIGCLWIISQQGKLLESCKSVSHEWLCGYLISWLERRIIFILQLRLAFKQNSFSLTLDLSKDFVVFVSYLKCFAFGYIRNYAFCGRSAELYLKRNVT